MDSSRPSSLSLSDESCRNEDNWDVAVETLLVLVFFTMALLGPRCLRRRSRLAAPKHVTHDEEDDADDHTVVQ
eukprot:CAMPEP_0194526276 /NCGR_PEP_ID=MMETSP0253-20130528/62053_1 /TAXON_ID=2966 /ORGANISM="Noctiluca scintillans" /LENGTH=72 /DNA_ID=CAMNT_0039371095 /DNA_START=11 /DNA_END=229 /DNA_ORIENTATION=+